MSIIPEASSSSSSSSSSASSGSGKVSPRAQRSTTTTTTTTIVTQDPERAEFVSNMHPEPQARLQTLPLPPPPPHPPPPPLPQTQMQTSSALASPAHSQQPQPQLVNGHTQHAAHTPQDAVAQLQQFAQWTSSAIEDTRRDMARLGNAVNNIEKDIRSFNLELTDLRNEVMSRPTARDVTALQSEIQLLRESRSEDASGLKGQKLSVDEFDILTESMSKISEKAFAVDDLKMQVDFLKSRTKRLEEATRGGLQLLPQPAAHASSEARNSPQSHASPFVPSTNHGLPATLQGPLSSADHPPKQGAAANHTPEPRGIPLIRKREAENQNILPSIPSAYPTDESERQQKRFKYTNVAFPGDHPMAAKEYRSLAAQPTLGAHEARTFIMTDNGDFKPSHPGFVEDPLTPKPKAVAHRGASRGRGRAVGTIGREMVRVTQYSPQPQDDVERPAPYQSYEGAAAVGTRGGEWLGSNPAVSAARTNEPYPEQKPQRRNSEGVVLTKNGRPDGRSIKRRPIQRNSDGIPVTRSGKPDGRFLAARTRKQEDQSQSPAPSTGLDGHSEGSHRVGSVISQEVATPTPSTADQLVVVERESMNGDASGDVDMREELVPVTPVLAAAPVPSWKAGND